MNPADFTLSAACCHRPRTATGSVLAEVQPQGALLSRAWWWALFPGLAVTFLSLSFTNLGYVLEEVSNPRPRRGARC